MKRNSHNTTLLLAALMMLISSCERNIIYTDTVKMTDEKWSMYDPANFSATISDTTGSYKLSFSVRTSTDYPYRNLYLFVITSFPSGFTLTDTLQARLSDGEKWLGKGVGDIRELTIPYKSNVYFPETGDYQFRIIQGMRDTVLKGVYDFGLTISDYKD